MIKLSDVISWGADSIEAASIENPYFDAFVLMSHLLGKDKSYLYSRLSADFPVPLFEEFSNVIKKRVRRYPLAYITGNKEFMSLNFKVNKNVLIPRPETELLVEETLKLLPLANSRQSIIVDIGTGCGNIALSLAKYNPGIRVYGTDISSEAIEVALENRTILGMEETVSFINCALWDYFNNKKWKKQIDILVSNPPYVETNQLGFLAPELAYEPRQALNGGARGLDLYPSLVEGGEFLLKRGGYLVMEIGEGQAEAVKDIVKTKEKFEAIITKKDYNGIDRIIIARRK